ncbi:hypothetical protein S83_071209 [Arachis hypogaea]
MRVVTPQDGLLLNLHVLIFLEFLWWCILTKQLQRLAAVVFHGKNYAIVISPTDLTLLPLTMS